MHESNNESIFSFFSFFYVAASDSISPEKKNTHKCINLILRTVASHPLSVFSSGRSKKKEHCLNKELYPLEETETCPCDEFLSQPYGNWSACILPDPSTPGSLKGWTRRREIKECGQGVRYRAVACIDRQGHLVDPALCTECGKTLRNMFSLCACPFN